MRHNKMQLIWTFQFRCSAATYFRCGG